MTVTAVTAEWNCTRCGATNRKLLAADLTETLDRCLHCKAKHVVTRGERNVRWEARVKS
jgi:DNA-directed RNA polymerase subunit RPC12/RpoP